MANIWHLTALLLIGGQGNVQHTQAQVIIALILLML